MQIQFDYSILILIRLGCNKTISDVQLLPCLISDICYILERMRCDRNGAVHWAHGRRIHKSGRTRPIATPNGRNGRPFGVVRWSWPKSNSNALTHFCVCPFRSKQTQKLAQGTDQNAREFAFRPPGDLFLAKIWTSFVSARTRGRHACRPPIPLTGLSIGGT